jgi:hypothetical protein
VLPDIGRKHMAKADVRAPDVDWLIVIGAAIQAAVKEARLSNKEAAGKAHVDDAEFGKWLNGTRRPHFDRLLAVPELRRPLLKAIARIAGQGITVTTHIEIEDVA